MRWMRGDYIEILMPRAPPSGEWGKSRDSPTLTAVKMKVKTWGVYEGFRGSHRKAWDQQILHVSVQRRIHADFTLICNPLAITTEV
eukprot:1969073-Amphidinium_carterae.1